MRIGIDGKPKTKAVEFPKNNQTVIVPGGFNPQRYYNKSEIDTMLLNLPSSGGGVPDDALTVDSVRMLDWSFGDFDTSEWDLGTNGFANIKWMRVGRIVQGWLKIFIDTDYTVPSGFFIIIHPDDLPYEPKVEAAKNGIQHPGGFGALYRTDGDASPPYDGFRQGLSPIIQDIGLGRSLFLFFRTGSEELFLSGGDNLWSPIYSTPHDPSDLGGSRYFGYWIYEAETAA